MKKKIIYLCVAIEVNNNEAYEQKEIDQNIQAILNIKLYDNVDKKTVSPLSAGEIKPGNTIQRLFDLKSSISEHTAKLGLGASGHITSRLLNVVQSVIDESPFKPKLISDYEKVFGPK